MEITLHILTFLLLITWGLPFIPRQHWVFRIFDFGRVQLWVFQSFILILSFIFINDPDWPVWVDRGILTVLVAHNAIIISPYLGLQKSAKKTILSGDSPTISMISFNVYQFNNRYQDFIDLVEDLKPDILLTMESNAEWDEALSVLDQHYHYFKKIPLENAYGMHFYTKFNVENVKVHYHMAEDLPSVEVTIIMPDHNRFIFFGIHPPPPSPTEEETSKERDGELMVTAKKVHGQKLPVMVAGDFNNVAWSRSSKLFRRASGLLDPRRGRALIPTFPAKYRMLSFPIDLLFHSSQIDIHELKTLNDIGSDHLPLYCRFSINIKKPLSNVGSEDLDDQEQEVVSQMIKDGKSEEGQRSEPKD